MAPPRTSARPSRPTKGRNKRDIDRDSDRIAAPVSVIAQPLPRLAPPRISFEHYMSKNKICYNNRELKVMGESHKKTLIKNYSQPIILGRRLMAIENNVAQKQNAEMTLALLDNSCVEAKKEDQVPPKGEKVRGKKRRPKRRPNPPNRPSPYVYFCNAKRPRVEDRMPHARIGDVAKELTILWDTLDEKKRRQWTKLAKWDDGESSNKRARLLKARLLVQEKVKIKQEVKDEEGCEDELNLCHVICLPNPFI